MANIQTRRSISFSAADFDVAQRIADRLKVPVAKLASQALRDLAARDPESVKITQPRAVADQVVIDDLRPDSPFRVACQLAGCGAVPGQACRPVPRVEGGSDPELLEQRVHQNRLWQVVGIPPSVESSASAPLAQASQELARNLQSDLDARIGVMPRGPAKVEPFTIADARRIVAEVSKRELQTDNQGNVLFPVAPGSVLDRLANDEEPDAIDRAIVASSVGQGLANIAANGITAELEDLEQDLAAHPDAGEVQVVYDEGPARRPLTSKRKRR